MSAGEAGTSVTITVTSSAFDNTPSLTTKRNVYVPATENVADVSSRSGLANATDPGPSSFHHAYVRVPPIGSPSFGAGAWSEAPDAMFTVRSAPASTAGGSLSAGSGATVIVTSSVTVLT